ncbi:hypothetical protein, partial [Paenibacillus lautus]
KRHSYFPNSTATEEDTACDTTADYFPFLSHSHRLPYGRPDSGGGHPLRSLAGVHGDGSDR